MRFVLSLVFLASIVLAPVGGPSYAQTAARVATVALAQEPDRFYAPATQEGQLVANLVFDPLVGLDDQMNPYPVLAATIPSQDNGLVKLSGDGGDRRLVVTMPLRQGVTWSDGVPFTADDVVYTWQLMMNPESGFVTTDEIKIKSVDKVDDNTVQFTYLSSNEAHALDPQTYKNQGTDPVVDPLFMFGLYDALAIYPAHILRQTVGDDPRHSDQVSGLATSDFAKNPVGTGPFVLSRWAPGNSLTFTSRGTALPQRMGQPGLDSIVFQIVPNKNDSLTALSNGEIQAVASDSLDASDAPVLDTLPGVQAHYTPGNAWEHLTFNLDNPILGDSKVRQAIGYALDRDALNAQIMAGKAELSAGQVPSWSWAFAPDLQTYGHDPGKANQLLDQAGWTRSGDGVRSKAGKQLSLNYWYTPATFRQGLVGMIKDQLAQVGIQVNPQSIDTDTLYDVSGTVPQSLVSRQFDIVEFAWLSSYDPGMDALYNMASANVPSKDNGYQGGNYGDYKNPRIDTLLGQLQDSIDPSFRMIALHEAQTIWQTDLPVMPLLLRPVTTASSTSLQNFKPTPAPAGETWNVEQWAIASS